MEANNILEIKDLEVDYVTDEAVVHAVNGLSLEVKQGETLGLVGETGAGKTTTALSVMRLLPKNIGFVRNGEITLDGKEILNLKDADMRLIRGDTVSMIFQDPMTALNPILTVGKQIAEVVKLHSDNPDNKAAIESRVDEIMEMVGISPSRKMDYPHQFSGGMKQRIVIAIALACEPKLLLADEPTTALDVTIQAQVLFLMKSLKETMGTSMLLITHDLGIVAQTCDRVAVMYSGEIVEIGTVKDIFEGEEHHPYTIGLFGSIPALDKDVYRLSPIPGLMADPTNRPEGCAFGPRCSHCMEICKTEPPKISLKDGHIVKCHLYASR